MICEKCQAPLVEGKNFCGQCGAAVSVASAATSSACCSGCGKELVPGKKFCGACGKAVQQEETATPPVPMNPVSVPDNTPLQVSVTVPVAEKVCSPAQSILVTPVGASRQKSGQTLLVLVVVIVVLLTAGVYFAMHLFAPSGQKASRPQYGGAVTEVSNPSAPGIKSDEQLSEEVQSSLRSESALTSEPIRIRVTRGVVIIDGSVSSAAARALVEQKVGRVKGVKTLIDNLTVK
jgi:BON domain/Double zinc ribbon